MGPPVEDFVVTPLGQGVQLGAPAADHVPPAHLKHEAKEVDPDAE